MVCKICGNTLLLGKKGQLNLLFCPICEKIPIIEKKKALKAIGEEIANLKEMVKKIFQKHSKKEIIGMLTATRELALLAGKYGHPLDSGRLLADNMALCDALKYDNFGSDDIINVKGSDFQNILIYYEDILESNNVIHLISNDYGCIIDIPDDINFFDYAGVEETDLHTYFKLSESDIQKTKGGKTFKFTEKWIRIRDSYREFDLVSAIEAREVLQKQRIQEKKKELRDKRLGTKRKKNKKLKKMQSDEFTLQNMLTNIHSMELAYLKGDMLYFKEFGPNPSFSAGVLKILSTEFLHTFKEIEYNPPSAVVGNLGSVSIYEFEAFLYNFIDNPSSFMSKIISSPDDVKSFPLVVQTTPSEVLIPPYALNFIFYYLIAKHGLIKDGNIRNIEGIGFEKIVAEKLKNIGINIDFTNFIDDPSSPTLEIDIIAHFNDVIFIIECKNWLLTSGYLFRKAQTRRMKNIKKEVKKQKLRIEFINKNREKLDLNDSNFTKVQSVIITKLREEISSYEDTIIIPINRLDVLLKGIKV